MTVCLQTLGTFDSLEGYLLFFGVFDCITLLHLFPSKYIQYAKGITTQTR
jgi:aminoglycoside N3'-acetyltransferase